MNSLDDIKTPLVALLAEYKGRCGTNETGAVRDALTELMHYCDRHGVPFDGVLDGAREVYEEELRESEE